MVAGKLVSWLFSRVLFGYLVSQLHTNSDTVSLSSIITKNNQIYVKMYPSQTKYVLQSLQLFVQRFFAPANLCRLMADIRALVRLVLQVQWPTLLSDFD